VTFSPFVANVVHDNFALKRWGVCLKSASPFQASAAAPEHVPPGEIDRVWPLSGALATTESVCKARKVVYRKNDVLVIPGPEVGVGELISGVEVGVPGI
jgi:hypothetical protein